ncbi:MAG: TAXI family TRAP transporter solute-binding subunit [Clostridia bacterium]|nr:TAXI family TRAP transporter solute-binding subunit [Clostridia bacterium]
MKKLTSLFLCALLCLSMLAACGGNENADTEKTVINFPTASASGALYAVGAAITNLWDTEIENVSAASQASTGGIENLNLVSEGEAQVSIAISSNCYECLNGEGSFDGYAYDDLKVIAGLYLNPNQMVVTEGSGIESLVDVKGKHFAVASAGSSVYGECYNHFTAAGLTFPDDINCEYITFADAADMLQNGTIDGAWIMSGAPASAVTQACTSGCRLVGVDEQTIAGLQAQYPWYVPYTIPAGTYPGQDEDVNTSAIKMVMFCRGDLSEDVVYELTKVFWENIDSLGESQAVLKGLTPEEAVRDIAELPLHPGAEKYYKEIKVIE